MSEENHGAVATQASPSTAAVDEAPSKGSSKAMLVVGAVAVVVLAVFAYVLFGTGGDSSEDLGTVPKAQAPAQPTKDASKTTDKTSSDKKSTKSEDVDGRNPFLGAQSATTDATTTETTDGTTTTTETPAVETVTLSLSAVGTSTVNVKVDDKAYKGVEEGETFATNFQVYAIFNDECAGFLYGDDSFALCEGKSVDLAKL